MVGGDVKNARDVSWGKSVPDGEFEHFAVCLAETARGGPHELADLRRVHGATGIGVQDRFVRIAQCRRPFARPNQSTGLVACDRVEPRAKTIGIAKLTHPLRSDEECLLNHVRRSVGVTHNGARITEQTIRVTPVGAVKAGRIACRHSGDERSITPRRPLHTCRVAEMSATPQRTAEI